MEQETRRIVAPNDLEAVHTSWTGTGEGWLLRLTIVVYFGIVLRVVVPALMGLPGSDDPTQQGALTLTGLLMGVFAVMWLWQMHKQASARAQLPLSETLYILGILIPVAGFYFGPRAMKDFYRAVGHSGNIAIVWGIGWPLAVVFAGIFFSVNSSGVSPDVRLAAIPMLLAEAVALGALFIGTWKLEGLMKKADWSRAPEVTT